MQSEDYKAFVALKDLLYTLSQDGSLDGDTRRMRDELIARMYAIRHPKAMIDAMKSVGYSIKKDGYQ